MKRGTDRVAGAAVPVPGVLGLGTHAAVAEAGSDCWTPERMRAAQPPTARGAARSGA
ncbi:hypothetical protein ACIBO5_55030 [Nonomuraea angiospora]|uniref:hypothetical protein n=1 Tax=Nonomuraea angiospora TaxID=46172 RepID=UPI0037899D17